MLIRRRKDGEPAGSARDIAFKVALDRFLLTPPYLALTLASLRLLQGLGVKRSLSETSALYWRALLTNWKVRRAGASVDVRRRRALTPSADAASSSKGRESVSFPFLSSFFFFFFSRRLFVLSQLASAVLSS